MGFSDAYAPTDSSLLLDGIRVLTRLLKRADERFGFGLYTDHTKRAKRRMLAVQHTSSASERMAAYHDLLKVADIIVKDRRDTLFGHMIFLTGEVSGLILDCKIERGNPPDTALTLPMPERQEALYGRVPRKAALDGGFASKGNLKDAKAFGIQDVYFQKKRGLTVAKMTRSRWVYKRLRDFRAGIEGLISFLKRAFGLDRYTWRGAEPFGSDILL